MADAVAVLDRIELARTLRTGGDARGAIHELRNAGALLAQIEEAGQTEVENMFGPACKTCGHRQIENPRDREDKLISRQARKAFREARDEFGVQAVASPTEAKNSDGVVVGYGTTVRKTPPNA